MVHLIHLLCLMLPEKRACQQPQSVMHETIFTQTPFGIGQESYLFCKHVSWHLQTKITRARELPPGHGPLWRVPTTKARHARKEWLGSRKGFGQGPTRDKRRGMIYTKTFAKANHIRLLPISLFLSPITLLRTDPQDVTLPPREVIKTRLNH